MDALVAGLVPLDKAYARIMDTDFPIYLVADHVGGTYSIWFPSRCTNDELRRCIRMAIVFDDKFRGKHAVARSVLKEAGLVA